MKDKLLTFVWLITRWFYPSWWKYLLSPPRCCWTNNKITWRIFWCRVGGHKAGYVWYNAGGDEPDMDCKNCREDLG